MTLKLIESVEISHAPESLLHSVILGPPKRNSKKNSRKLQETFRSVQETLIKPTYGKESSLHLKKIHRIHLKANLLKY